MRPTTTRRRARHAHLAGNPQQRAHTILVAFDVEPTTDSNTAMALLEVAFSVSPLLDPEHPDAVLESWHFAEDDRIDGNDSQSAVFCRTGCQAQAHAVLVAAGLA